MLKKKTKKIKDLSTRELIKINNWYLYYFRKSSIDEVLNFNQEGKKLGLTLENNYLKWKINIAICSMEIWIYHSRLRKNKWPLQKRITKCDLFDAKTKSKRKLSSKKMPW